MSSEINFKIWNWFKWLYTILFWGAPVYLIYDIFKHYTKYNQTKIPYLMMPLGLAVIALIPFTVGNLIVKIAIKDHDLVFKTLGRLPLVPYGTDSVEICLPKTSILKWSHPHLFATAPDGMQYMFTPAVLFRIKRLASWLNENGLPKPQGM